MDEVKLTVHTAKRSTVLGGFMKSSRDRDLGSRPHHAIRAHDLESCKLATQVLWVLDDERQHPRLYTFNPASKVYEKSKPDGTV